MEVCGGWCADWFRLLRYLVCERILTKWGVGGAGWIDGGRRGAQFVSQSSHNGVWRCRIRWFRVL